MTDRIYKIVDADLWRAAEVTGCFRGSRVDEQDGFIHFSTAAQVEETARRHFAGEDNLLLVAVSTTDLPLRWESARGGDQFPHLYEDLPLSAVAWVKPLPLDEYGRHVFPEL